MENFDHIKRKNLCLPTDFMQTTSKTQDYSATFNSTPMINTFYNLRLDLNINKFSADSIVLNRTIASSILSYWRQITLSASLASTRSPPSCLLMGFSLPHGT